MEQQRRRRAEHDIRLHLRWSLEHPRFAKPRGQAVRSRDSDRTGSAADAHAGSATHAGPRADSRTATSGTGWHFARCRLHGERCPRRVPRRFRLGQRSHRQRASGQHVIQAGGELDLGHGPRDNARQHLGCRAYPQCGTLAIPASRVERHHPRRRQRELRLQCRARQSAHPAGQCHGLRSRCPAAGPARSAAPAAADPRGGRSDAGPDSRARRARRAGCPGRPGHRLQCAADQRTENRRLLRRVGDLRPQLQRDRHPGGQTQRDQLRLRRYQPGGRGGHLRPLGRGGESLPR